MKVKSARIVGWAIPFVCLVIAIVAINQGRSKMQLASKQLATARFAEGSAVAARDAAKREVDSLRQAAEAPGKAEESTFLEGMRGHAADSHVQISRWASHPPMAMSAVLASSDAPRIDPAIKSIIRIDGELTLDGPYQGIRLFFKHLATSDRLYIFNNVHWTRKGAGVELTLTITRYLDSTLRSADQAPWTAG